LPDDRGSKMDLSNLSTIIAPNILRPDEKDSVQEELYKADSVVFSILSHMDELWSIPADIIEMIGDRDLMAKADDLTGKDILKRYELYLKTRKRSNA